MTGPPAGPLFAERLWPSAATWLLVPGAGVGFALVLLPLGPGIALATALAAAAGTLAGLVVASAKVEVAGGELRAGRAHVPLDLLGPATAATGEDARLERGPRLDARAYLCVRGWVDPVVRVELTDPADPTPYWLISTRRPQELTGALSRTTGSAR